MTTIPARTASRLQIADRHDSYRTLSDVALADLVQRGLFDEDSWTVTAAGRAELDRLAVATAASL